MSAQYRICRNCNTVLRPEGRGWVHWDGFYRCTSHPATGDGYAAPYDPALRSEELTEAEERGYEHGYADCADKAATAALQTCQGKDESKAAIAEYFAARAEARKAGVR